MEAAFILTSKHIKQTTSFWYYHFTSKTKEDKGCILNSLDCRNIFKKQHEDIFHVIALLTIFLLLQVLQWEMLAFYYIIAKDIHIGMMIKIKFKFFMLFHSIWNIMEKLRVPKDNVFLPKLFPSIGPQRRQVKCMWRLQEKYIGEC